MCKWARMLGRCFFVVALDVFPFRCWGHDTDGKMPRSLARAGLSRLTGVSFQPHFLSSSNFKIFPDFTSQAQAVTFQTVNCIPKLSKPWPTKCLPETKLLSKENAPQSPMQWTGAVCSPQSTSHTSTFLTSPSRITTSPNPPRNPDYRPPCASLPTTPHALSARSPPQHLLEPQLLSCQQRGNNCGVERNVLGYGE